MLPSPRQDLFGFPTTDTCFKAQKTDLGLSTKIAKTDPEIFGPDSVSTHKTPLRSETAYKEKNWISRSQDGSCGQKIGTRSLKTRPSEIATQ